MHSNTHYIKSMPLQSAKLQSEPHRLRVRQALLDVGIGKLGVLSQEGRYLPKIVHTDETIGGAVYGWSNGESVLLVATNKRLIFLDKKPLFVHEDEISFDVVSGISFSHAGVGSVVTLHTRIKDYVIRTYNQKSLTTFVDYIESRCLDSEQGV